MTQQRHFSLVVGTSEITTATGIDNIKRELYNAQVWLSDFCKDDKLLSREHLEINTVRIIEFFTNILREEGRDIHDYASCSFVKITSYSVEVIFKGYRFE